MAICNTKQVINDVLERIKEPGMRGQSSGYPDLDYCIGGFESGKLYVIGGRPAMGKSALILNMIEYMSILNDKKTVLFSLELPKEEVVNRLIMINGRFDTVKLKLGNLDNDEWDRLIKCAENIGNSGLLVDDVIYGFTIEELVDRCKSEELGDVDVIFIDYLHLLCADKSFDSRQHELAYIIRQLKELAKELNKPVVVTSQLSRAVECRPDHRPMLSDLRESGAIEETADAVIFLYRDEYYNFETDRKVIAELIVAKNNAGLSGIVELAYLRDYMKFASFVRTETGEYELEEDNQ